MRVRRSFLQRIETVFFFTAILITLGVTASMIVLAGSDLGWDDAASYWLRHVFE